MSGYSTDRQKDIARSLRIAAIGMVAVALLLPAFEYANGFGAESTTRGWQAAIIAAAGAVIGFVAGPARWAIAAGSTLLNLLLLSPLPSAAPTKRRLMFDRFATNASGISVFVVSLLLLLPNSIYWPYDEGPKQLHIGAYVWLTAMWLNWIGRMLRRPSKPPKEL